MIIANKKCGKMLTAGVLLSALAVNAEADINPGNLYSGSGELFLSVWDQTQLKSYSLDLGVSMDSLLSNPAAALAGVSASNSLALGSSFASMYVVGDTLSFNLAAANKYVGVSSLDYGIIISHNVDALQALPSLAQTTVQTDATKINNWATTLNTAADTYNHLPINTGAYSENLSEVSALGAVGALGNTSYYASAWTNTLSGIIGNGAATATNTATTTHALQLYFYGDTVGVGGSNKPVLLGNDLLFSLDAANGVFSWTSTPVTTVPVPGSFWLFFSAASVFFMRLGKRKNPA